MSISSDTVTSDPRNNSNISNEQFKIPFKDFSRGDPDNDIVICGIGGRYPECADVQEFWDKLLAGVEFATIDDRRWPVGE